MLKKNAFVFFGVCALLLSLLSGCSKSADDLYTEGKTLILNKETFTEGIKTLKLFEKKYHDDSRAPEVVLALAMAYQGERQYEDAASTYKRLMDKYPASPETYKGMFMLGYMYYDELKDDKKTLSVFTEFIETYPDSELISSAKVLIENIGLPVEDWSIVKEIGVMPDSSDFKKPDK